MRGFIAKLVGHCTGMTAARGLDFRKVLRLDTRGTNGPEPVSFRDNYLNCP